MDGMRTTILTFPFSYYCDQCREMEAKQSKAKQSKEKQRKEKKRKEKKS
jgi:ATP sulfurylase